MRRLSLAMVVLLACSALWCSKKKDTVNPPTTGTLQGVAQTAVGDTVLAGVRVSTSPATSSVSTDGLGHYSIPDIPGGEYAVTGTKAGFTPFIASVSVVAGQTTNADLTMARLAPTTGSIGGQVRTSTGDTLIVGATVVTSPATSSVLTDAQGRYEIRDAPPGQYIVTATKGGYIPGTINVSVVAGSPTTADILMTRTGPLEGSIQGQVKTSVGDSLVVGARVETAPATSSVTTDQQGRYAILHVLPGQYAVTATKTGYNPGHTSVSVIAGQATTADIRLTNVLTNTPPYEPVLLFPDDAAANQPGTLTLRWSAKDPDGDPLSYDVYLDTLLPPVAQIATSQIDTTHTLARLHGATTYYWRVVAHGNRGGLTPSQVRDFATRPDSLPTDGLVAYYGLNGNSLDDSGHSQDLIGTGTIQFATDRFAAVSGAIYFDGSSRLHSPNALGIPSSSGASVSAWILPERYYGNGSYSYAAIAIYDHANERSIRLWVDSSHYQNVPSLPSGNKILASTLASNGQESLSYSLTNNVAHWMNAVVVVRSDSLQLWIDGELQGTQSVNGTGSYFDNGFSIGGNQSSDTQLFKGRVDDVRVYARSLTRLEIQHLYHEGGW